MSVSIHSGVVNPQGSVAMSAMGGSGVASEEEQSGITQVGTPTSNTVSNADMPITEPDGVAEGDLLLCFIGYRSTVGYSTPTGWTKVWEQNSGNVSEQTGDSIGSGELYYIVRGADAPTLTFTIEGDGTIAHVARARVAALRGVDTSNPVDSSSSTTAASNTNSLVTEANCSASAGQFVFACATAADNVTISSPQFNTDPVTPLTMIVSGGSSVGADVATGLAGDVVVAAVNAPVQFTFSGSRRHVVGFAVINAAP